MADDRSSSLPQIADCNGCGVCCFHMGYPAFMIPRAAATEQQIDSDPELQSLLAQGWTRQELVDGNEGESHWHSLPDGLKQEWIAFVDGYERVGDLDGPCFWFDLKTRMCRNHTFRPNVCRDFETGSSACLEWRAHYADRIPAFAISDGRVT